MIQFNLQNLHLQHLQMLPDSELHLDANAQWYSSWRGLPPLPWCLGVIRGQHSAGAPLCPGCSSHWADTDGAQWEICPGRHTPDSTHWRTTRWSNCSRTDPQQAGLEAYQSASWCHSSWRAQLCPCYCMTWTPFWRCLCHFHQSKCHRCSETQKGFWWTAGRLAQRFGKLCQGTWQPWLPWAQTLW